MNVLDELRSEIQDMLNRCPPNPSSFQLGHNGGLRSALLYLDALRAAHPGLVDRTVRCRDCGQPTMDSGDGFTVCFACYKERLK